MDFTRLPDAAFLKIFKYLPLEERIRIGRVNKAFRRISQSATSQTTSLDLTEDRFRNLTADQLAIILDLCSANLKSINLPPRFQFSKIVVVDNIVHQQMDFSRLPDDAILKIFKYLPLEECIRIGRVNKTFRRISQYVTSQTTSLDLKEDRFRNLNADQLAIVLDICSPNLKEIEFPSDSPRKIQMATILANYQCPKLVYIDLKDIPIDYVVFDQLMRNNPNIEDLEWRVEFVGFPNITCNGLEELDLNINGDASVQTLIGRCPNLNILILKTKNITGNVLDEFFSSTQQIQKVKLRLVDNQIVLQDLVFFWNLPLTFLIVIFDGGVVAEGGILQKVARSFPHLQTLAMHVSVPSNQDIAALVALQELEKLEIISDLVESHDDGIGELVACKKLRYLSLRSSIISPATLIAILRSCPQLECVLICAIGEVETPEAAAVVLGSFSGIEKRDIVIRFYPFDDEEDEQKFMWESEAVKEAIRKLEQAEGLKVKIDWI